MPLATTEGASSKWRDTEQSLLATEWRHLLGRVGENQRDHVLLQGLEDVGSAHTKVVGVVDGDHPDAIDLCALDGYSPLP